MSWQRLWKQLGAVLAPPPPPEPGLYAYPFRLPGGQRRLHLRVEEDGRGVLFVDVTDVLHLNPTATEMAKLALDGVLLEEALSILLQRYRGVERRQLTGELQGIYQMVEQLGSAEHCPTCAVAPLVGGAPLFSTPVAAPFKADLALTYRCNNACAHCYNEVERFGMGSLDGAGWFEVLDRLAAVGVPHVILTGGEPTLHPEIAAIVRHADALGLVVGMNTNGRRLADPARVEALVEAGLNHVQVTLESSRAAVHDAMVNAPAFDETVQGIRNALEGGLHTITNTTLTRHNVDHALEVVDFVAGLGLGTLAMNGMIYAGGGLASLVEGEREGRARGKTDALRVEELVPLLDAVRERSEALGLRFLWYTVTDYCLLSPVALGLAPKRCNAAEYSICIEPNGDVLPCQSYYTAAGNILEDPWESIWESDLFRSFRERGEEPEGAGLPEGCWDCPDLPLCGGGCRLEREARANLPLAERGCGQDRRG
ncbi:MAG: radical SAM protein [Anaerolineales bacterium]